MIFLFTTIIITKVILITTTIIGFIFTIITITITLPWFTKFIS